MQGYNNQNYYAEEDKAGDLAVDEQVDESQDTEKDYTPQVATAPSKNIIVFALLGLAFIYLMYSLLFSGGDKKGARETKDSKQEIAANSIGNSKGITVAPVPEINPPRPPINPLPPIEPVPPQLPQIDPSVKALNEKAQKVLQKRIESEMIISSGGLFSSSGGSGKSKKDNEESQDDPNLSFADGFFNSETVPHAKARRLTNLEYSITQGKIIDAVLETPINTDVPGMVRAVVSRDIYAENGKNILIPKGSRIVGTYNSFVVRGNKRVNVIWSRVIRPDGIDIMVRSPATDKLGTAGIQGVVDNKYLELFSSAFLLSAINIGLGAAGDAISNSDELSQTTTAEGSTVQRTDATTQATLSSVSTVGRVAGEFIENYVSTKPTVFIPQGSKVKVFVNRDLLFPPKVLQKVRFF